MSREGIDESLPIDQLFAFFIDAITATPDSFKSRVESRARELGFIGKVIFSEATWLGVTKKISISPGNWSISPCVNILGNIGEPSLLCTQNGSLIFARCHYARAIDYARTLPDE